MLWRRKTLKAYVVQQPNNLVVTILTSDQFSGLANQPAFQSLQTYCKI